MFGIEIHLKRSKLIVDDKSGIQNLVEIVSYKVKSPNQSTYF